MTQETQTISPEMQSLLEIARRIEIQWYEGVMKSLAKNHKEFFEKYEYAIEEIVFRLREGNLSVEETVTKIIEMEEWFMLFDKLNSSWFPNDNQGCSTEQNQQAWKALDEIWKIYFDFDDKTGKRLNT